MTSWPSCSRWRATHSLSVLASRRMRAGGGNASLVAGAVVVPDAQLALALVKIESYRIHGGWPPGGCLRLPTMSTLV
jgi:hypothetical protein